jgi:hypothetical protein
MSRNNPATAESSQFRRLERGNSMFGRAIALFCVPPASAVSKSVNAVANLRKLHRVKNPLTSTYNRLSPGWLRRPAGCRRGAKRLDAGPGFRRPRQPRPAELGLPPRHPHRARKTPTSVVTSRGLAAPADPATDVHGRRLPASDCVAHDRLPPPREVTNRTNRATVPIWPVSKALLDIAT